MITTLKYQNKDLCNFLGRNGHFKQTGIEVYLFEHYAEISPITSKNETGRAWLQIPIEEIPALIEHLQEIVEHIKGGDNNPVRCNNCDWKGAEADLIPFEDEDGPGKGCPQCETDAYLANLLP